MLKSLIQEINIELNSSFIELDEKDDEARLIRAKVCQIKKQMDLKTTSEAEKEYLSQTSYIILARIILTKCWEDLGLIEPPNTYNGGFKLYIENYHQRIRDVYQKALDHSQDIYFLFNPNNPYLLLPLSEQLIVDIFFQICKYDFNSLNYDILGYIYEEYLDLENRKKFGQYYTPPYIVNLILDRIGYKSLPNELLDSTIMDPASGSGTFLLNAARRVLHSKQDGLDHSIDYKNVIENNIFGSELMLFPYLISEINILIQASQMLKKILEMGKKLNVFYVFPNNSFNLIDKIIVNRLTGIPEDEIRGDNIIDSAIINRKIDKLTKFQHKVDLDFVVGNPPYVANDTNPELFREMRQFFTFCDETYHNKMDLFYWFIILGIAKLRQGGKLCYITTRYWLDKGEKTGVETLKEFILKHCYLREIIDLRNLTVFISATGQENIIFILEKKSSKNKDENIRIFRIQPRPTEADCLFNKCFFEQGYCMNDQEYLECLCSRENQWNSLLEENNLILKNYIKAFASAKKTEDLKFNRSWDIFYPSKGLVRNIIDKIYSSCTNDIERIDGFGSKYIEKNVRAYIKDFFIIRAGVMTTADEYFILTPDILRIKKNRYFLKIESSKNLKRSEKQTLINRIIGEIDDAGYIWLELSDREKKQLLDLYKTPSVYRHGLDISKRAGKLIYFDNDIYYNNCPALIKYLEQFKGDIVKKLEGYKETSPSRPNKWITLRRGASITLPDRKRRKLEEFYKKSPKIFYNYRVGNDNIFGFTNQQMVAVTDMYFFHKYGKKISTYYILAYLNSKIMKFFFKERPIELHRHKSNVENDIPIFVPRNDFERILESQIIKKEIQLTRKLAKMERVYRSRGFHFTIPLTSEEEINVDLQQFLRFVDCKNIEKLAKFISGDMDIYTVNRRIFPVLIYNQKNVKKIGTFKEIITETDVHFSYKSLKVIVDRGYYEKIKLVLESYIKFEEKPNFSEFLKLKVPTSKSLELINIYKIRLFQKISPLSSDEKLRIDETIDKILNYKDNLNIGFISSASKILYFIDMAFVKMIAPEYKEEIMAY
ncbi:MAG: N-6 DNA methylase [Candidatus Thorarchaeota archaeon]